MVFAILLRVEDRIGSLIKTRAARGTAILGPGTRFTGTGRVYNIRGMKDAIVIGANSVVAGSLTTFAHLGKIRIGEWCYVGEGSRIWSACEVTIGDRVQISHNVDIHDTNSHPFDRSLRYEQNKAILKSGHPRQDPGILSKPVSIGNDAWIGFGATILKGVTIGEGAIVGAHTVVTRDVPPFTVVVGNPARVARQLDCDASNAASSNCAPSELSRSAASIGRSCLRTMLTLISASISR